MKLFSTDLTDFDGLETLREGAEKRVASASEVPVVRFLKTKS
jgi:hypothetical protein